MAALAADLNASKSSDDDEEQEPHKSWPPIFMSTKVRGWFSNCELVYECCLLRKIH